VAYPQRVADDAHLAHHVHGLQRECGQQVAQDEVSLARALLHGLRGEAEQQQQQHAPQAARGGGARGGQRQLVRGEAPQPAAVDEVRHGE
jgi:hypothetical protein